MSRDQYRTGGAYAVCKRGNDLPHARLDPEKVKLIRDNRNGWPRWKWADLYGVHVRTIDKVCNHDTWRHV